MVVISVNRSKNSVNKFISNWQMDVVLAKETDHEMTQLFLVECAVFVFIKLDKKVLYLFMQRGWLSFEMFELLDDFLKFTLFKVSRINHI